MPKLNQILAIERQTKEAVNRQVTDIYHALQKEPLLNGISRTYRPLAEDGERFPSEETQVQVRVTRVLESVQTVLAPLYNITAARDAANCEAAADVVVDGKAILSAVPATTLLWLEKQFVDLNTLISKLPTLPQSESWEQDPQQDCYRTKSVETAKSKKIAKPFVKYEATPQHPAQVEVVHEDILTGYWSTIKFSGALPMQRVKELRERVEKLLVAVKFAREQANLVDVPKVDIATPLLGYLFA